MAVSSGVILATGDSRGHIDPIAETKNIYENLEAFLYNESNRINKSAIKFLTSKYMCMKDIMRRLVIQNETQKVIILENEHQLKRMARIEPAESQKFAKTYAKIASLKDRNAELKPKVVILRANDKSNYIKTVMRFKK